MAGELLKVMAGINIVHVPYKGNAPALTDAIGGHVEMILSGELDHVNENDFYMKGGIDEVLAAAKKA
mgnify:CR=1 FL=1